MATLFDKLNLKQHKEIVVLNAPDSFTSELKKLEDVKVWKNLEGQNNIKFVLVFVKDEETIEHYITLLLPSTEGDAIFWFAYPKKSSKNYTVTINRDKGWDIMSKLGLRPVRQVSIDEDWSALRFRKSEYIGK